MYILHTHRFNMPQLNRERTIRVLMPRNYFELDNRYPVIYMQDGQNLFDPSTAFGGNDWKIPVTLSKLSLKKQAIIVGIDNGDVDRMNEYAPFKRGKGGGEGDQYIHFIIETLKPFIDSEYRTMPHRETTGIAGSSMGGLIALYAGLKYGEVFGKVGVLSPSIWFNPQVLDLVETVSIKSQFYIAGSKNEMRAMESTLQNVYWTFNKAGFAEEQLRVVLRDRGKHNETMWRNEFKKMYDFLLGD